MLLLLIVVVLLYFNNDFACGVEMATRWGENEFRYPIHIPI